MYFLKYMEKNVSKEIEVIKLVERIEIENVITKIKTSLQRLKSKVDIMNHQRISKPEDRSVEFTKRKLNLVGDELGSQEPVEQLKELTFMSSIFQNEKKETVRLKRI